ncbi:unnamed protein product [Caenorhabditis angaria]|uniref:Uncharacterized protein n=1 Tax=Caenorhabditis angaria TaxID=860376 RepID=A0A9P1IVS4_9PELO|nr:unnamed protein product [Caenorhabditis angaria]
MTKENECLDGQISLGTIEKSKDCCNKHRQDYSGELSLTNRRNATKNECRESAPMMMRSIFGNDLFIGADIKCHETMKMEWIL